MALHHLDAGEKVHLPSLDALSGAKAVALVKTDRFETLELVLGAGDAIPSHAVLGYTTLHCLKGRVVIEAAGEIELSAGDWLYLGRGQAHAVAALDDSSVLVTILFD